MTNNAIRDMYRAEYPTLGNFGPKHGVALRGMITKKTLWSDKTKSSFAQIRRQRLQGEQVVLPACSPRRNRSKDYSARMPLERWCGADVPKVQTICCVSMYPNGDAPFGCRHAGDWKVDAVLLRSSIGQAAFVRHIKSLSGVVWIECVAGAPRTKAAMSALKAIRIGTRYSAEGDIYAIYLRATKEQMAVRLCENDQVEGRTCVRLPVTVPTQSFNRLRREVQRVLTDKPDAWATHYSKKNKGKAWSAIALYGFSIDPTDIAKPTVIKTSKRNPGITATRILRRNPALRKALDAVLEKCGVKVERVRVMRLAATDTQEAEVSRHSDLVDPEAGIADRRISRIHLPLVTNPQATMTLWGTDNTPSVVQLKAGRWFYLDARKPHAVKNHGNADRLHLVVDLVSNPSIRSMVNDGIEMV